MHSIRNFAISVYVSCSCERRDSSRFLMNPFLTFPQHETFMLMSLTGKVLWSRSLEAFNIQRQPPKKVLRNITFGSPTCLQNYLGEPVPNNLASQIFQGSSVSLPESWDHRQETIPNEVLLDPEAPKHSPYALCTETTPIFYALPCQDALQALSRSGTQREPDSAHICGQHPSLDNSLHFMKWST